MRSIYTVGHSTHHIEVFLKLLRDNGITAVADVRSSPYSRYASQFNSDALRVALEDEGIAYVYLGAELGARSCDDTCYVSNVVSFKRLAETELFQSGIRRVEQGSDRYKIAMMCAERDPTECHRTILVSRVLEERGAQVKHILGSGEIEEHKDTMLRVLDILKMPREDMFLSEEELIAQAYSEREKQVAYRRDR